ncbi:porin family protein [Pseudoalteromonas sp. OFAV1]|uniref:outer membrane beta-barrel protein n=1 Tax=Pseudoalteromonas sp. OFAV1 TaxID=2908892 RepID=UPI001F16CEA2|nr:outer membrane beta-barrel protein [Pseudoalteromonas sp. OFAV1]MCF2903005.1 porin family protein [Pseudoalteromonas sp. OFAV1]
MKKVLFILGTMFMASGVSAATYDNELKFYVGKANAEVSGSTTASKDANVNSIGFGLRNNFAEHWASEIKYTMGGDGYFKSGSERERFDLTSSIFVNGMYKVSNLGSLEPYMKVGVGVVNANIGNASGRVKESTYLWGVGFDYSVSSIISLGLEYEKMGTIEYDFISDEVTQFGELELDRVNLVVSLKF